MKKNLKASSLPDVVISPTQQVAAQSLIELLTREQQDANQRIGARRLALNRWADDLRTELKLPKDRYQFDANIMAFVDKTKLAGSPL